MPENDFEKQVQQKMDELQFVPSDAVWPEVERQIEQRKKRRGVFFWLPLGVLLLGGAAWIYLSGVGDTATKKQTADKTIVVDSAGNERKISNIPSSTKTANTGSEKAAIIKDNANIPATENEKVNAAANNIGKHDITAVKKSSRNKDLSKKNKSGTNDDAPGNSDESAATASVKIAKQKNKAFRKTYSSKPIAKKAGPGEKSIPETESNQQVTESVTSSVAEKNDNDVAASSLHNKISIVPAEAVADSITSKDPVVAKETRNDSVKNIGKTDTSKAVVKTKKADKTKKKIEWGVNISAGASSLSDGFSGLFASTRSYDAAAFLNNQQSSPGNINAGGSSNAVANPSEIKPGFSYAAGMFVNIPLNKKINFLTGINYAYYSNRLTTGVKSDSTGTTYYALGNFNNYTNRFHFIEIPFTIQLHTARFGINGGLSFSMIAGTNALLYNAQGKYYYRDNSLINKVQTGVLAGFSYRLFPKKMPIDIGPQINYNLTSIFNKDLYGGRHLFFGGVNAKFYLHKK